MKNVNDILAEISAAAEQRGRTLIVASLDDAAAAGERALELRIARREVVVAITGALLGAAGQARLSLGLRTLGALTFGAGDAPPLPSEQRDLDRLRTWAER